MDQIHRDRLQTLAAFLDTLPAKKFTYGSWVQRWQGDLNACGTTACAFGWATSIPEFRALGLHITRAPSLGTGVCIDEPLPNEDSWRMSVRAGNVLFGLDEEEFAYLFAPSDRCPVEDEDEQDDLGRGSDGKPYENATPKQVAAHIRHFLNNGRP